MNGGLISTDCNRRCPVKHFDVDKSGKWLHIVIPEIQPDSTNTRFLNLQTGAMQPLVRAVDHPPGHGDLGTENIVGFDNNNNAMSYRHLSNVHAWTDRLYFRTGSGLTGGVSDWTQDFHGTMLADNENQLVLNSRSGLSDALITVISHILTESDESCYIHANQIYQIVSIVM